MRSDPISINTDFSGDHGGGGVRGLVPAPGAGDAAAGKYLKADGTWSAVSPGETNLDGLTDVVITTPADNEVLAYDSGSSKFINQSAAAAGLAAASHTHTASEVTDFNTAADARITAANLAAASHTHTASAITDFNTAADARIAAAHLNDLTDVTVPAPASGDYLKWNGTAWVNSGGSLPTGMVPHLSVRTVQRSNVTLASALENGDTLNGLTLATGDDVLLIGQTDQKENRIWRVKASGAPDPHPSMPNGVDVSGWLVSGREGTNDKDREYLCTSNTSVTGTNGLTWALSNGVFLGDGGSGGEPGCVPAPAAGDAAANKYLHADGTFKTVTAAAPAGILPFNHLVNPSFRHWARNTKDPTAALTTADGAYGATCWYTLANNTTVTQQRVTGSTAPYALKLNTPSGSVDMWGCAQIVASELTYSLRGKSVTFQVRVKRSEAKKIRIALLEWTGTADAPTKDVVNNWASTNYTTGNFFISSNYTLIGTASTGTMTADTYNTVSVSGSVSGSANNLVVVIWSEDALVGTQSLTIECPGLYEGSTVQTWAEGPQSELTNPLRYAYGVVKDELNHIWCLRNDTKYIEGIDFIHPVPMRAAPTTSHNISGWAGAAAPTTTLVTAAYYAGGSSAYVTISGGLTVTVSYTTKRKTQMYLTAGTSFLGSSGNVALFLPGPDVQITNSAEIGV